VSSVTAICHSPLLLLLLLLLLFARGCGAVGRGCPSPSVAAAACSQSPPELAPQHAVDDEVHRRVGGHDQVADVVVVVVGLQSDKRARVK